MRLAMWLAMWHAMWLAPSSPNRRRGLAGAVLALGLAVAPGPACNLADPAVQAHIDTARQLLSEGRPEEALAELELALQIDPESAEAHANAGLALVQLDREDEAIGHFEEAFRLQPLLVRAGVEAAALQARSRPERALELTDEVLARDPDNRRARNLRVDALLRLQRFDEATEAVRKIATERPDDGVAQLRLARVILARASRENPAADDLMTEGLLAFDAALETLPAGRRPGIELQRARLLGMWPGHEAEAALAYEELLEGEAEPPALRAAVVDSAVAWARRQGEIDLLERALRARLAIDADDVSTWMELARVADREGRNGLSLLDVAIERDPANPAPRIARANRLAAGDGREAAVQSLLEAADEGVAPDRLLDAAVQIELRLRRFARAAEIAERIRTRFPDSPYATISKARVDLRLWRTESAETALEELLLEEQDATALRLLAIAKARRNRHVTAVEAMDRARQLETSFDERHERMAARLAHAAAMPVRTLTILAGLEEHGFPLTRSEQLIHAQSLFLIGQDERADQVLDELVAADPPLIGAVVEFGNRHRDDQPDRVREVIGRARSAAPESRQLLAQEVALELALGRSQESLERIEKYIEGGGRVNHDLFLLRIRAYLALGRVKEAHDDLLKMLRIWPGSRDGLDLLAQLYEQEGRLGELVASFDAAADAGTLRLAGPLIAGRLHLRMGDFDTAAGLLEPLLHADLGASEPGPDTGTESEAAAPPEGDAVADASEADELLGDEDADLSDPSWPEVRVDMAWSLAESGHDLPRAVSLARDGLQLGRDVEAHVAMGLAFLRTEELQASESYLARALALSRSMGRPSAATHLYRGELYRELGRTDEARAEFERSLEIDPTSGRARAALDSLASVPGGGSDS